MITRIDEVLPPYWSRGNPIDMVGELGTSIPKKILEALVQWDQCDAIIHLGVVGRTHLVDKMLDAARTSGQSISDAYYGEGHQMYQKAEEEFFTCSAKLMEKYGKPILGVFLDNEKNRTVTDVPGRPYKGIAFLTPERAVETLSRMVTYSNWLTKEGIRHR